VTRKTGIKVLVGVLAAGGLIELARQDGASADAEWRTASRAAVGLAPDPAEERGAIVQVYAARTVRWRGYFGVHTWIATKLPEAAAYRVYEVVGWRLRRTGSALSVSDRAPDGRWFGRAPRLIVDLRGAPAEPLVERIDAAARSYPYTDSYRIWPGPNSNTFTAHVLRAVPELRAELPPTAIGKDFLGSAVLARSPSGTGWQLSAYGLIGVLIGAAEGLEINLLGLTFGIDVADFGIKLPIAGQLPAAPLPRLDPT
jgi:hypothetical protein